LTGRTPTKVTIFDYGVGNLHSISKALEISGAKVLIATTIDDVLEAKAIVFPGVGEFGAVMKAMGPKKKLLTKRLLDGVPTLGICIGFQVMFDTSEESKGPGLGLIEGRVLKFKKVRIPHMGWNTVNTTAAAANDPLMKGIPKVSYFYFANSYVPAPKGKDGIVLARSDYGRNFPSVMRKANIYGTQFHPEKSSRFGLRLIKNFINFASKEALE
jgi:imidazole glycerol-phosphate synthase subunit HisH